MKDGPGILLEDGSLDITHLMDDEDRKIWADIFDIDDASDLRMVMCDDTPRGQ